MKNKVKAIKFLEKLYHEAKTLKYPDNLGGIPCNEIDNSEIILEEFSKHLPSCGTFFRDVDNAAMYRSSDILYVICKMKDEYQPNWDNLK